MKTLFLIIAVFLSGCVPAYGYHYSYYGNYAGVPPQYPHYDYRVNPYTAAGRAFLCRAGEYVMPLQHPQPIGTPCVVFVNGYPVTGIGVRN